MLTDRGVADYLTNDGYVLGYPFIRAFMLKMDFQNNEIGFAQKNNHLGTQIITEIDGDIIVHT